MYTKPTVPLHQRLKINMQAGTHAATIRGQEQNKGSPGFN